MQPDRDPPEASFRGEDTRDLSPNKPPLPEFRLFNQVIVVGLHVVIEIIKPVVARDIFHPRMIASTMVEDETCEEVG